MGHPVPPEFPLLALDLVSGMQYSEHSYSEHSFYKMYYFSIDVKNKGFFNVIGLPIKLRLQNPFKIGNAATLFFLVINMFCLFTING